MRNIWAQYAELKSQLISPCERAGYFHVTDRNIAVKLITQTIFLKI